MTTDTPSIQLAASLDLKSAGPLRQDLLAVRGNDVSVDASDVRRVGGQCLQVLLAAQAAWASDGHGFAIKFPSPAFIEGVALMGAAERFGLTCEQEVQP